MWPCLCQQQLWNSLWLTENLCLPLIGISDQVAADTERVHPRNQMSLTLTIAGTHKRMVTWAQRNAEREAVAGVRRMLSQGERPHCQQHNRLESYPKLGPRTGSGNWHDFCVVQVACAAVAATGAAAPWDMEALTWDECERASLGQAARLTCRAGWLGRHR